MITLLAVALNNSDNSIRTVLAEGGIEAKYVQGAVMIAGVTSDGVATLIRLSPTGELAE